MDLVTLVYLADVLPNIAVLFIVMAAAAMFIGLFPLDIGFAEESVTEKRIRFIILPVGITFAITAALIPSKTTMYMMAGASIAQEVHRDERTKKVYEKLYQVIDEQLDKALKK